MTWYTVQPEALSTFSTNVTAYNETYGTSVQGGMKDVSANALGLSGLPVALGMRLSYGGHIERALQFHTDAGKGIAVLGIAAAAIGTNYVATDMSSADEVANVNGALTVDPNRPDLNSMIESGEAEDPSELEDPPPMPEVTDGEATPTGQAPTTSQGQTVTQEVSAHIQNDATYGGNGLAERNGVAWDYSTNAPAVDSEGNEITVDYSDGGDEDKEQAWLDGLHQADASGLDWQNP